MNAELRSDWQSLFSSFERTPIASASIGQVHRAVLASNGKTVAIKIQFPGIASSISSDLANLSILQQDEILSDTFNTSYKMYNNGCVVITKDGYQLISQVDKLVWADKIQPRDFEYKHGGDYLEFLKLATDFSSMCCFTELSTQNVLSTC